jgi:hypothetical protein
VVGFSPSGLAFLWSPTTPNTTSGTRTAFLGNVPPSNALAINSYGQVVGSQGGTSFIWTPSTPNGTTGTIDSDTGLAGAVGLNDYGQVITSGTVNSAPFVGFQPVLFTPSVAQGNTGTFTTLEQIYAGHGSSIAINSSGSVVGWDRGQSSTNLVSTWIWTAVSANATTGTITRIAAPAGLSGPADITPAGMNASGSIVGSLAVRDGNSFPFLYAGGVLYDLSVLNSSLAGGVPAAINDKGQIVLNSVNGNVYLLTPQRVPPAPRGVSPPSGGGLSQTMMFTFLDPRGSPDLGVVNILINTALDGRNACYLAYSVPSNTLYLVNDAGQAGGPFAGATTVDSANTIQNSQCAVRLNSASSNGTLLTLTLDMTFKTGFAGNKVVYLAAGDLSQNNSGWTPWGTWQVPGAAQTTTTSVVNMAPANGAGLPATLYTFRFSDTNGYQDLGVENMLVNTALDGRNACYLAYARPIDWLYIVNDAGTGLLPGASLGSSGSINNSQCAVSWANNAVTANGNNLSLALNIGFSTSGFGPNLIFYLAARDVNESNNTGWQALG